MEIFSWFDKVPDYLKTRNQLAELGLRPGGLVRGQVVWRRGKRHADLYAIAEAKPKREATPAQRAALAAAREAADLQRRTCPDCKRIQPYAMNRVDSECFDCMHDQQEADRQAAVAWARTILADSQAVVIDTETTGLGRDAWLVEIAIITLDGQVLLHSLINPGMPIPAEATAIHGITDADVAAAPSFADLAEQLQQILAGRTILAYNAGFDQDMITAEAQRWSGQHYHSWPPGVRWRDVMKPYSAWVGEWSSYYQDYRWQRLLGGHRALGDCQATLAVLKCIASTEEHIEE